MTFSQGKKKEINSNQHYGATFLSSWEQHCKSAKTINCSQHQLWGFTSALKWTLWPGLPYLYCGDGLPSARHWRVASWSGELMGRIRSLGSFFKVGPLKTPSSVRAGNRQYACETTQGKLLLWSTDNTMSHTQHCVTVAIYSKSHSLCKKKTKKTNNHKHKIDCLWKNLWKYVNIFFTMKINADIWIYLGPNTIPSSLQFPFLK